MPGEPSIYAPVIDTMEWSYSRIKAFDDCPYRWYLKYLYYAGRAKDVEISQFFSQYGTMMHKLLAWYYGGVLNQNEVLQFYIKQFNHEVTARAPTLNIYKKYYQDGLRAISNLDSAKLGDKILAVEEKVKFNIGGKPFVGYIDLVTRTDEKTSIIDHKSRNLSKRSNRKKPTKRDKELDEYQRQLYLYAEALKQECGAPPDNLVFDCFRSDLVISEPYMEDVCLDAKQWALDKIEEIRCTEEFRPNLEWFKCKNLCEMREQCEFYEMSWG